MSAAGGGPKRPSARRAGPAQGASATTGTTGEGARPPEGRAGSAEAFTTPTTAMDETAASQGRVSSRKPGKSSSASTRRPRTATQDRAAESSDALPAPGFLVDDDGMATGGDGYVPPDVLAEVAESPPEAPSEATEAAPVAEDDAPPAHATDLERKLERILGQVDAQSDPEARRRAAHALTELAARLADSRGADHAEEDLLSTARELLSSDYYVKQWGRVAMRNRSEVVDDFGLDPAYEARVLPWLEALYRRYFRVEAHGLENVPAEGRALLVANHGGALPWDGLMLKMALRLEHPQKRELRWLAEDFVFHAPFLGAFVNRIGAVRACQENAERLLDQDKLVAVFPEGAKGMGKLYRNRYQLQRFGRGGYVKLALRTGAAIVPTAVVGAEEANPTVLRLDYLAKLFSLPYFPITPTFPWLGPFGLMPLPTKWIVRFGEPIELDEHGTEAAENAVLVNRLNDKVRTTVQALVDRSMSERRSLFI